MEEVYRCVAPDGFRAELAAEGAWGAWLHEVPPVDASKGMIIAAELRGDLLAVRNFRRGPRDVANAIVTKRRMVLARDDDLETADLDHRCALLRDEVLAALPAELVSFFPLRDASGAALFERVPEMTASDVPAAEAARLASETEAQVQLDCEASKKREANIRMRHATWASDDKWFSLACLTSFTCCCPCYCCYFRLKYGSWPCQIVERTENNGWKAGNM